jgi:hypothetical protein
MGPFRNVVEDRITTILTVGRSWSHRQASKKEREHPMSMESFEQFRQIVLHDLALQERLRPIADHRGFVDLVVQVGTEQGCHFTPADVEAAMQSNRLAWLQHRMVS